MAARSGVNGKKQPLPGLLAGSAAGYRTTGAPGLDRLCASVPRICLCTGFLHTSGALGSIRHPPLLILSHVRWPGVVCVRVMAMGRKVTNC
jgi:hypothetical protein